MVVEEIWQISCYALYYCFPVAPLSAFSLSQTARQKFLSKAATKWANYCPIVLNSAKNWFRPQSVGVHGKMNLVEIFCPMTMLKNNIVVMESSAAPS
jgi:hypothetical protein